MTSSTRTTKNAPDAGQGVEGNVPTPSKEHENMSSIPAPAHTVNLPPVVAPQIAEWDRLVDATDPIVDAGQPDPLGGYDCPAWCEAGRDVDSEHVHVVDVRGEQHESAKAHVLLSLYEGEDRQQYVRVPSLDVHVTATTRHPRPRPYIDVARTTASGTTRVARMNVDEARALIRTLSAAVDLATGRDDWPDEPVPYALTGKAGL